MGSKSKLDSSSRIPNFFRMSVAERIAALAERGLLTDQDVQLLANGRHTIAREVADKMIENVIGVFGLPNGVALNFQINGRDYVVPLVVEEPSIVAGLSGAARMARANGGYQFTTTDPVLIGQVQVVDIADTDKACSALMEARAEILDHANSLHPNMVARGGGAIDIETHVHTAPEDGREMVVLHLLVDTREAMGANLVNTMCEGVAPMVEQITGGNVHLRILSNLTDRAIVKASVSIPVEALEGKGFTGEAVRDGIVLANDLALVDPYRAATHNKGIMNGVDAVAIATGNDWRAIEAAAHAYAARDGQYRALTRWTRGDNGNLEGSIEIPMKVGTVGGSLETNPTVRINHRLLGTPNATDLAGVMGVVGLAQNFAALRSLSTSGIQHNHMKLHARSVASTAGVPDSVFDKVVDALIESGEIKVWKAEEILDAMTAVDEDVQRASAYGKVILLGEHSVVYGQPAFAVPLPLAVEAHTVVGGSERRIRIQEWGYDETVNKDSKGIAGVLYAVLQRLSLADENLHVEVTAHVPPSMGLGGSAALAVAVIRSLDLSFKLGLSDEAINAHAFECEKAAHGTPSGIDNTIATYGQSLLYQRGATEEFQTVRFGRPLRLVIGMSRERSITSQTVGAVRNRWEQNPNRYERIFAAMGELTREALKAGEAADWVTLGELMNHCHGYLNALQLSTPEVEHLVQIARASGALGAKLTGGGGGGSIVALAPDSQEGVAQALEAAGYQALAVTV